ncbi:endonuclease/exonuclease/phosphatase family protein [Eisenibacter elegans]|jgi:endonuclease/exonuclease/phosphatase family metal-dependent hydrolase|uniref:endonuclease/exonuclease/phosphatase family protein n=1 Tax=Eisenibacter elegans TaxID=997 RepID=UPI000403D953|nr:endonuclease/exonuclease/phosphatase family protein [Eisenibacter elegans]
MKVFVRFILSLLLVGMLSVTTFYFWGSAGKLSEAELTQTYVLPNAQTPTQSDSLVLVSFNIGYLAGMTNNLPLPRTQAFVDSNMLHVKSIFKHLKPDVVGYQEIDYGGRRAFDNNQSEVIATRLGFGYRADAVNWDKNYVPFPYAVNPALHFGRVLSGQSVHSRYPILSHKRIALQKVKNAPFYYNAFYLDRLAQVVELQYGRDTLVLINVHLEAFDGPAREAQTEELLNIYRSYRPEQRPVLLIGDFNSNAPTEAYRQSADYERVIDLILAEPTLASACVPELFSQREQCTYPADKPDVHIDYIFYNPKFWELRQYRVLNEMQTASDHLPIMAILKRLR